MLNHIFVPNTLVCIEPGGEIDWEKLIPYIWENLNYDGMLVDETLQYNQLRGPYEEVKHIEDLKQVHQYYITTTAITEPVVALPNSMILVYSKDDQGQLIYLVLARTQTFFQYAPTNTGYTYTYSSYDPTINKTYLRPYGEWPVSTPHYLIFNSNRQDVTNLISYHFSSVIDGITYSMIAPIYFNADQVNVRLYLYQDSQYQRILTCPAHYEETLNTQTGQKRIDLVIDSPYQLPSIFYVEVF